MRRGWNGDRPLNCAAGLVTHTDAQVPDCPGPPSRVIAREVPGVDVIAAFHLLPTVDEIAALQREADACLVRVNVLQGTVQVIDQIDDQPYMPPGQLEARTQRIGL